MVLCGRVNGQIVSLIAEYGGRALGLSGRDDRFLRARRVESMKTKKGTEVDPGRVGEIVHVNTDLMRQIMSGGFIPVIAPVAVDERGEALNVNADFVASHIAGALKAEKLVLMTDIEGVRDDVGHLQPSLDRTTIAAWLERGVISGGMIPKVRCALEALDAGVGQVHVIDGRMEPRGSRFSRIADRDGDRAIRSAGGGRIGVGS
jgi:acetylglutamate kinase